MLFGGKKVYEIEKTHCFTAYYDIGNSTSLL